MALVLHPALDARRKAFLAASFAAVLDALLFPHSE